MTEKIDNDFIERYEAGMEVHKHTLKLMTLAAKLMTAEGLRKFHKLTELRVEREIQNLSKIKEFLDEN